ncbi:ABC-type xenobiotic transporter [Ranunculus cassubicifolius]
MDLKCKSFGRSISQGSSEFGRSNRDSFTALIPVPTGHMQETMSENPESITPQRVGKSREVPLHRLAFLNKPEIHVLLLGILSSVVAGVLFPVFAILLSSVVKIFFEPKEQLRKDSRFWAFMLVILGVVSLVVHPAKTYFFSVAGCRLIQRIRSLCFKKVVHMEINWFDEPEHSSGSIGSRLSADAATLRSLVGDALALLLQNTASVVPGLAIAFEANWILAFIILGLIPLIGLNGFVQMKFMKGVSADAKVCSTINVSFQRL